MCNVCSFFKNSYLDFSKINAHFTQERHCRVCLGRKDRIEYLIGEIDFAALVQMKRGSLFELFYRKVAPLHVVSVEMTGFLNDAIKMSLFEKREKRS